jgi:hypothetical protein
MSSLEGAVLPAAFRPWAKTQISFILLRRRQSVWINISLYRIDTRLSRSLLHCISSFNPVSRVYFPAVSVDLQHIDLH